MSGSISTSTSPPLLSVSAQSPTKTDVREVGNSGNQERWLNMGSSSFSPPRPGISSLPSILNTGPRLFLAALRDHSAIINAPSIGGAVSAAIGEPIVGPVDRPLSRPLDRPLGGQLGGPSTLSGKARSYPPPPSTFTPTACRAPKYPPWSTLDRSPRQTIHYRPVMKHSALSTIYPGGRQLSFVPPRENSFDDQELIKIDVSSRPSVIQAMRIAPPSKSQRMSKSMESYDRDPMSQPERTQSEEDIVREAICDDQDAEIIHKKFSKYIL